MVSDQVEGVTFLLSLSSCICRPPLPTRARPVQQQPPLLPIRHSRRPLLSTEAHPGQQPLDLRLQHPLPDLLAQAPPGRLLHRPDLLRAEGVQGLACGGLRQDLQRGVSQG